MNTADIQQRFAAGEGDCIGTLCIIPESGSAHQHKSVRVYAPKEYIAVLENPDQFDSLHRKNHFLAEGVHTVFGVKHGEAQLQALYFSAAQFTPAAAITWLRDRGLEPVVFTQAAESKDTPTAVDLVVKELQPSSRGGQDPWFTFRFDDDRLIS